MQFSVDLEGFMIIYHGRLLDGMKNEDVKLGILWDL